jgi:hypothetical protein
MGPVLRADRTTGEFEVRLVNQGGGLEGMAPDFAPQNAVRGLPKFLIYKGKEAVQGFTVASPQLVEQSGDFA